MSADVSYPTCQDVPDIVPEERLPSRQRAISEPYHCSRALNEKESSALSDDKGSFESDPVLDENHTEGAQSSDRFSSDPDSATLRDDFDWLGEDEDEEDELDKIDESKRKAGVLAPNAGGVIMGMSKNTSNVVWICFVLFGIALIAVDVTIFVVYHARGATSLMTYNLELWFTWMAFMWVVSMLSQVGVECVPWFVKKLVAIIRPQRTEVFRVRLSYYMALRQYLKLLAIASWAWGAWAFIQHHVWLPENIPIPHYVHMFFRVWECCFVAAMLLFIEKVILQMIVTKFHRKAYGGRLEQNERALRILDRLKNAKRRSQDHFLKRFGCRQRKSTGVNGTAPPSRSASLYDPCRENKQEEKAQKSIMVSHRSEEMDTKSNVKFPSNNMDTRIAIPPIRNRDEEKRSGDCGDLLDDANDYDVVKKRQPDEKKKEDKLEKDDVDTRGTEDEEKKRPTLSRSSTGFSSLNNSDDWGFSLGAATTAIFPAKLLRDGYRMLTAQAGTQSTTMEAKLLAERIYYNIVGRHQTRSMNESDFYPFFNRIEEAKEAFGLFDADSNEDVSRRELRSGCIRFYRERKNLARSMRDLSQATGKLDIILLVIATAVWVIIVLAICGINVGTQLMPLWSGFIAASFIFGSSAKDAFESLIFVFVTHPFDAGDRIFIEDENWVVENVGLLVSSFIKWDGTVVYAKNSILSTKYIINCRRSGRTSESTDIHISFNTPAYKIYKIRDHMLEWCNDQPTMYTRNATCANIISFVNQNRITITFFFEHTKNWQDIGGRWMRHNNFMMELKEECERLELEYDMPAQPFVQKGDDGHPGTPKGSEQTKFGLNELTQRRPYSQSPSHIRGSGVNGPSSSSGPAGADPGATSGAAATMMFASTM